jgi:hypothetical protein
VGDGDTRGATGLAVTGRCVGVTPRE